MISWWEMGPKALHPAGRLEEMTSAFHTRLSKKRINSHRQQVWQQSKGSTPEVQILIETWFLLKPSLCCPTWCLVSDSAISKNPGLNQPQPEGEVLLELGIAGEVRCKFSHHILTPLFTGTSHLSFFHLQTVACS